MDGEGDTIGCGTVFRLSSSGGQWKEIQLYGFTENENNMPGSALSMDSKGALFSTAGYSVFRLIPGRHNTWTKQTLFRFEEGINGTIPSSGVLLDAKGNLLGTTWSSGLSGFSTAYELSLRMQGRWSNHTLQQFGHGLDSDQPFGGLVNGKFGWLYGATLNRSGGGGYIFALEPL
jgi:hypothetical protein